MAKNSSGYVAHTYTFIIKDETSDGSLTSSDKPREPITPSPDSPSVPTKPKPDGGGDGGDKDVPAKAKWMVAYSKLKDYSSMAVAHRLSQVALRTGRNELQARAEQNYAFAQQAFGIAESIVAGAIVGNVAGAVVGAVAGLGNFAISTWQQADTLNLQRQMENQALALRMTRAGSNRNV